MEGLSAQERLRTELELLEAMYPDQVSFDTRRHELKYTAEQQQQHGGGSAAVMVLRLPESYPETGLPDVISATDGTKLDARTRLKTAVDEMGLSPGEEVLDAIIRVFEDVVLQSVSTVSDDVATSDHQGARSTNTSGGVVWKTVVIWLHHLLNTNKRKLALNPRGSVVISGAASDSGGGAGVVSGITKPGYPGMLVYSGPRAAVDAHVSDLKMQRWQAFQVRFEMEGVAKSGCWEFAHGRGVVEVESMADVVQGIKGEEHRQEFLKAAGIK